LDERQGINPSVETLQQIGRWNIDHNLPPARNLRLPVLRERQQFSCNYNVMPSAAYDGDGAPLVFFE
jgi:hypothetical protein